ncbi:MAG TPA: hypothetical protein VH092_03800 [Urbifossiella sp.]|jgi:hypothetical protein|nr:hypothetical protein [Urbifossiella sp.]
MYRITQALSVGRFPTPDRAADLLVAGVTHILNVSGRPGEIPAGPSAFREVAWVPLDDDRHIPPGVALRALGELHRMAAGAGAHVYVHCAGGCLRGPTVLWLYLVACGLDPEAARTAIEARSPGACPGHDRLVGPDLVRQARAHGLAHFLPLPRGEILTPAGGPA